MKSTLNFFKKSVVVSLVVLGFSIPVLANTTNPSNNPSGSDVTDSTLELHEVHGHLHVHRHHTHKGHTNVHINVHINPHISIRFNAKTEG